MTHPALPLAVTPSKRYPPGARQKKPAAGKAATCLPEVFPDLVLRCRQDGIVVDCHVPPTPGFSFCRTDPTGRPITEVLPHEAGTAILSGWKNGSRQAEARDVFVLPGTDGEEAHYEARTLPCGKEEHLVIVRNVATRLHPSPDSGTAMPPADPATHDLVATLSHEMRTPVTGIIGLAELLMSSDLPPVGRRYADCVLKSAHHLLELTNRFLDAGTRETGKPALAEHPFDLRVICEEVIDLLMPDAAGKNLALSFNCSPDLPTRFAGDAARIRQILLNLVGNAIKFTDAGHVAITGTCLECDARHATLRLEVTDTGIGMSKNTVASLFRKYYRGDPSRCPGTGLGLAITKALVELLGGVIGVQSSPGKGSMFWFTLKLPVAPADVPEKAEHADQAQKECMGLHVLVVEDDHPSRLIAAAMLESMGCRVDMALSGEEAVEMAVNSSYDIVFMDCSLPGMDGLQAAGTIRALQRKRKTAIVALTANADGHRGTCLNAGMDDFLTKPLRYQDLQEMLEKWASPGFGDSTCVTRLEDVAQMFVKTGRDFLPTVVEPFLKNVEGTIPVLMQAIAESKWQMVWDKVHRLQGGSSSLGIEAIRRICSDMLHDLRCHHHHNLQELVRSLHQVLPQVREQVVEMRKNGLI